MYISLYISTGGHEPPPCHTYIYSQKHRSVFETVNHYQLSFRSFAWFTDMRIYNASQTSRTWLTEAHWQALASFWITDTGHIQQSLYEAYTESPQKRIGQYKWGAYVRYTDAVLLIRVFGYAVAISQWCHLSDTPKCTFKCISKDNMVLIVREEPITTM